MMDSNYFVPLISFSGLLFGLLLDKIAHEEIKYGLVYFFWAKKALLSVLIIVLLLNLKNNVLYLLFGVIIGFLASKFLKGYFFLGLGCILSTLASKDLFFLTNALVFLYGLPEGSLIRNFNRIYINFLFFSVNYLFLFGILKYNTLYSLLIGVCCGGLFRNLTRKRFISF